MVATVQREPFSALIRKIGYSAGLENTRERIRDLVHVYERGGEITTSSWSRSLVREKWGLNTNHIADVFSALNLVDVHSGVVDILFGLDALAISKRVVGEENFEAALDAIFCSLILISDADVFLNCLAAEFDPESVRHNLINMVQSKRLLAHEAIRLSGLREKVDRIINIEAQKNNRGSASAGKGVNLLTRTQPLGGTPGPLARAESTAPAISADYLRKVPPKRREWARSIGLFEGSKRTQRGDELLELVAQAGGRNADGSYALWPFVPELTALHLTEKTAPWPTVRFDQLTTLVSRTYKPELGRHPAMPVPEQVDLLASLSREYRSLNHPKAALRGELPLRVAYLVQVAWNVTKDRRLDIGEVVELVKDDEERPIEVRSSRNHEGAILVRRKG